MPPPPPPPSNPHPENGNLFRRFTSKFRSSAAPKSAAPSSAQNPDGRQAPQRKHTILRMPKGPAPVAATNNDFTNAGQRQAALRAAGLLPPAPPAQFRDADGYMKTLSQQEAELDRRVARVVEAPRASTEGSAEDGGASEARKIREAWLAKQDAGGAARSTHNDGSEVDEVRATPAFFFQSSLCF